MRVRWLRSAIHDLDTQADYLAQDDVEIARHIYTD